MGSVTSRTVCGHWEIGWNTPISEVTLWEFMAREYGADLVMCPVSGIRKPGLVEVNDLPAWLNEQRTAGKQIVFVDEGGSLPLRSFVHPSNAVYVTGRTSLSPLVYSVPGDLSVRIETAHNLGMLWGHQAALLVLADRLAKVG